MTPLEAKISYFSASAILQYPAATHTEHIYMNEQFDINNPFAGILTVRTGDDVHDFIFRGKYQLTEEHQTSFLDDNQGWNAHQLDILKDVSEANQ